MQKMKTVVLNFTSLEGNMFRYSLSYCMLLALLPTLIIVILLFQNRFFDVQDLMQFLYHYLPEDLMGPFINYIMEKNYTSLFGLLLAIMPSIYLASRSFYSFLLVSATHEKFKTKGFLLRIKAFLLFLGFVLGLLVTSFLIHFIYLPSSLLFFIGIFTLLYLLFRTLSFEKRPVGYGMIGSFVSSLGIVLTGSIFFSIINKFTSYQNVYGPLGSLVILLLSIYVISSIIYFGYCLNLEYGKRYSVKIIKMKWFYELGEKMFSSLIKK